MYRQIKWRNYRSKSKYGNKKAEYNGQMYHSKFESKVAEDLDLRRMAGEFTEIDRQVKISLDVNGHHICNYYIDFVATRPDGIKEYIEAKGFATDLWRLKWKLFEALYKDDPLIEMIVIKQ